MGGAHAGIGRTSKNTVCASRGRPAVGIDGRGGDAVGPHPRPEHAAQIGEGAGARAFAGCFDFHANLSAKSCAAAAPAHHTKTATGGMSLRDKVAASMPSCRRKQSPSMLRPSDGSWHIWRTPPAA